MIEKTIYIANDGTQFDDEDECIKHELNENVADIVANNELLIFGSNNKMIHINDLNFYKEFEKACYIVIKTERAYNYLSDFCAYYGFDCPYISNDNYKRSYYYDFDNYDWDEIKDRVSELKQELMELKQYMVEEN